MAKAIYSDPSDLRVFIDAEICMPLIVSVRARTVTMFKKESRFPGLHKTLGTGIRRVQNA